MSAEAASPASPPPAGPAKPTPIWRAALPWVLALGVLAWLFHSVPFTQLRAAVERVSPVPLVLLLVVYVIALFAADSLGTLVALRRALPDHPLGYGQVLRLRGASYLFSTLHYGAGQGAFALFLQREAGIPLARVAGAVLLGMGANIVTVTLCAGVGVAIGGTPAQPILKLILLGLAVGLPVYLAVIAWRPSFLERFAFLTPLFDAGVRGHLAVAVARLPHIASLMLGHYAALHLFGVPVPLGDALTRLPLVFVVAVLPLAPSGLGTSQAAAVALLASYAPGATPEARAAAILAYSLTVQFGAMLLQALLGVVMLAVQRAKLRKRR